MTDAFKKPTKTTPEQTSEIIARVLASLTTDWQIFLYWQERNQGIAGNIPLHCGDVARQLAKAGYVEIRDTGDGPLAEIRATVCGLLSSRPLEEEIPLDAMDALQRWDEGRPKILSLETLAKRLVSFRDDNRFHDFAEELFGYAYRDQGIEILMDINRGRRVTGALERLEYRLDYECATPSDYALMEAHPAIEEAIRVAKAERAAAKHS